MNKKSLLTRLLFAFVLALGFASIWMTLAAWFASLLESRDAVYESLVFTPQGEPIIQARSGPMNPVYRGLDGQRRNFTSEAIWLNPTNAWGVGETSWMAPPVDWKWRIKPLSDGGSPPTYWYFMHDGRLDGRGYFVGYGSNSKQVVGYLGQGGFRDAPPVSPKDFFAVPLRNAYGLQSVLVSNQSQFYGGVYEPSFYSSQSRVMPGWRVYLIDGNRIVQVDLRNRDAPPKTILEAEGLLSVALLSGVNWNQVQASPAVAEPAAARQNVQEDLLIASTADAILVYDPVAEKSFSIDRPENLKSKTLSIYRTINGDFILQHFGHTPDSDGTTLAYTLSPHGAVKNRIELQLNPGQGSWSPTMSLAASVVTPFPLASTILASVLQPFSFMQFDKSLSYGPAFAKSVSESWLFLAVTYLLGGVLAWRCYLRQRRFADPAIIPWVLLVFVLGVPGYLGYRLHRRWPIRLLCPSCNRPSPRDRERCIDCGADFPLPEAKGIEVFA